MLGGVCSVSDRFGEDWEWFGLRLIDLGAPELNWRFRRSVGCWVFWEFGLFLGPLTPPLVELGPTRLIAT